MKKALNISQNKLRNVKKQEKKNISPFISTFNRNNPKTLPIIKQTVDDLKTSDRVRNTLEKNKKTQQFINCKQGYYERAPFHLATQIEE